MWVRPRGRRAGERADTGRLVLETRMSRDETAIIAQCVLVPQECRRVEQRRQPLGDHVQESW
jgi:hypothetical protein